MNKMRELSRPHIPMCGRPAQHSQWFRPLEARHAARVAEEVRVTLLDRLLRAAITGSP